jgi:hypothetical protein
MAFLEGYGKRDQNQPLYVQSQILKREPARSSEMSVFTYKITRCLRIEDYIRKNRNSEKKST